jgi:glycosyltransferase involved in cell wall biosynthesis
MFELAKRLNELGDSVTVVTAFPNYPTGVIQEGYRGRFAMEERMDGVRVLRRWVFATPNSGVFKRIFNWLSFVVTSLTAVRKVGPVDVIFVQSPPLPIGMATLAFARLKRAPFVFNVSDIWPQSAVELGMLHNRFLIRLAEALEMHIYRRASRVTVPTPGMLERLAGRGVPPDKAALVSKAQNEKIGNVLFLPNQPKASMPALLNVAYAGIVSLRPLDLFRNALPSKMFESMAVGQPLVAALWGEGADLVRAAGCGLVTEPGNAHQLREAVETLAADPDRAREMGRKGRDYVDEHYNRRKIAVRLHELLAQVARR